MCVCCAKERGVRYERVARANRATDSAPAWRQWKTKHGSTCVEKEQSICPWRQPLPPSPPPTLSLFPSLPLLLLSLPLLSPHSLLPWFTADRNKARAGVMGWILGQEQHWTLYTQKDTHTRWKEIGKGYQRFLLYVVKVYSLQLHSLTWCSAALMWFKSGCGAM